MTQDTGMLVLVIDGNIQLGDNFAHGVDDFVVAFLLDMTVSGVNDGMTPLGKTADNGLALFPTDGKLHFIAVIPRRSSANGGFNIQVRLFADTRHRVDNLLTLGVQLSHIVKVLQLTAAAFIVDAANRLHSVCTLLDDFFDMPLGIGLFHFINDGFHRFARQGIGHKYRKLFIAAYAFTAGTQRIDYDFISFSFFDGNFFAHCLSSFFKTPLCQTAPTDCLTILSPHTPLIPLWGGIPR